MDDISVALAGKTEVVNFFCNQRCSACLTIGKFTQELDSGKIVYKEINGELSANREIVVNLGPLPVRI